jgi:carboxyl-terminal processing protease
MRRLARRFLLPLLSFTAVACTGLLVGDDVPESPATVFDTVWSDFDRYYASFALRNVDWDAARTLYRPQALAATTPQQLYAVIGQMLKALRDPHVILYRPDGTEVRSLDLESAPPTFSLSALRNYAVDLRLTEHGVIYGVIDSATGYVRLSSFNGANAGEIDQALTYLGSPAGLIVDVRGNLGGYVRNAEIAAARFADRTRRYRFVRYRNGPRHDDFTPFTPETVAPDGRRFSGPVVVLTDRQSASAAEDFVLAMRVRPLTAFIGDTTAGALSIPMLRELPGGSLLRVPQAVVYDVVQVSYEGIGLAPTVVVRNNPPVGSGRDLQLEAAIARLRLPATP